MFWAPEVLPTVLRASVARPKLVSRPYHLDLSRLSGTELRQASDGWHAVVRLKGATHRLLLRELPAKGQPIALELLLDADFELQSRAAHGLFSAIYKRVRAPPLLTLALQRQHRLKLAMRALDGRLEGSSYRTIAETLFGKGNLPERSWKTHDLRNRTIRLVQGGLSLMRGGYRGLLRGWRSKG